MCESVFKLVTFSEREQICLSPGNGGCEKIKVWAHSQNISTSSPTQYVKQTMKKDFVFHNIQSSLNQPAQFDVWIDFAPHMVQDLLSAKKW